MQPRSVLDDFFAFLKSCNCDYTTEKDADDNETRVTFDYQAGHFVAIIKDSNVGVEVNFPCFFDVPASELQLVRTMCNRANQMSTILKYVYSFNDEENRLHVHLSFYCNTVYPDQMGFLLKSCFYFQRDFVDNYKKAKENQEQNHTNDIEATVSEFSRERWLVAMQEMRHDTTSNHQGWRANDTKCLRLNDFIEKALGITAFVPSRLVVVRDGVASQPVEESVGDWDMSRMLIEGEGKDAIMAHDSAVAIVNMHKWDDEQNEMEPGGRILTITAMADGSDDKSLYMRVTACLSANTVGRSNSLASQHLTTSVSVLMAYDRAPDTQRQQEFDYMWKDARIKIRDGEPLTEQQQLIYDVARANIAYNLYWGKSLMLSKRYYEALLHFENVYYDMLPEFFQLSDELKSTFMDVCYSIGFCYNELHQYQKAFYFLHFFDIDRNVRTTTEWVNCLANARDIRVFKVIDDCLNEISEHFKDVDELPEGIPPFVNFLRRRRAYALIDFNDLDEAEKAFTEMLDDPDNSDYAMGELAYIARLREQRGQAALPEGTTTDKDPAADASQA
ncbi:MAG: hypothetical protein IKR25_10040 [Muribaculaceae bacterium]|nr:hypothetical protein [Muribaculaceae bacterium]